MAMWTNYWKIITPNSTRQDYSKLYTDNYDPNNLGVGGFSTTTSFYNSLLKGPGTRISGYQQYDMMDTNADVSRALDIIAEEIACEDKVNGLPLRIEYQVEENQEVSETTVTTLRSLLRHWVNKMDIDIRLFAIARYLIKYGDCFFQKEHDSKKWKFIDPYNVIGVEINEKGEKVAYHLKSGVNPVSSFGGKDKVETEIVPAAGIVHITLCDEMGSSAPFGESVLKSVFNFQCLKTQRLFTV